MNIIKADKYQTEEQKQSYIDDAGETPRFGFCWWSWYPKSYTYFDVTDIYGIMWLCYCVEFEGFKK